jgi:hypothetical protein
MAGFAFNDTNAANVASISRFFRSLAVYVSAATDWRRTLGSRVSTALFGSEGG